MVLAQNRSRAARTAASQLAPLEQDDRLAQPIGPLGRVHRDGSPHHSATYNQDLRVQSGYLLDEKATISAFPP
jgi:hypothetical protein